MITTVIVACENASGEADFFGVRLLCTDEQYNLGEHYDSAFDIATSEGYSPSLGIDEIEPAFEWFDPMKIKMLQTEEHYDMRGEQ